MKLHICNSLSLLHQLIIFLYNQYFEISPFDYMFCCLLTHAKFHINEMLFIIWFTNLIISNHLHNFASLVVVRVSKRKLQTHIGHGLITKIELYKIETSIVPQYLSDSQNIASHRKLSSGVISVTIITSVTWKILFCDLKDSFLWMVIYHANHKLLLFRLLFLFIFFAKIYFHLFLRLLFIILISWPINLNSYCDPSSICEFAYHL